MWDLVDELERLVVLEDDFFLLLLLVLLPLFIRLPLVYLELLPLGVLAQLQQKLRLLLQKLEQLYVVVADVQRRSSRDRLLPLVDLLYQRVDRLACLDRYVLVLFQQKVVQLVEQVDIVLRRYQVPLQNLQHQNLILGHGLTLAQRVYHIPNHLLLEREQVRST